VTFSRALVLGAGGQLGCALVEAAPAHISVTGLTRAECDIANREAVSGCLNQLDPQVVINAAAYTAVDDAEDNPELAFATNADGPGYVAAACARAGVRLLHVSTDFVFDGGADSPYPTDATPVPLGVYGDSKLHGEDRVQASGADHAILRTSWVYAATGRNFVLTMLRLMQERPVVRVVNDQIGAPTMAAGLAGICWSLALHGEAHGIFHWSDAGEITWYDFACGIRDDALSLGLLTEPVTVEPITTAAFPTKAKRPPYSVLDARDTAAALGVAQRPWREALRDMLGSLSDQGGVTQ
jgi:dTDP-4-dehydrorhamnose reductase